MLIKSLFYALAHLFGSNISHWSRQLFESNHVFLYLNKQDGVTLLRFAIFKQCVILNPILSVDRAFHSRHVDHNQNKVKYRFVLTKTKSLTSIFQISIPTFVNFYLLLPEVVSINSERSHIETPATQDHWWQIRITKRNAYGSRAKKRWVIMRV